MKKVNLFFFSFLALHQLHAQSTPGCTDPLANNYNVAAQINDGSCQYNNASVAITNKIDIATTINETSGLLYHNGTLWTHNDNDDTYLYGIDTLTGQLVDSISLEGLGNVDWEAIAQDDTHLYIGDIGNNARGNRQNLKIYKVAKQSLTASMLAIDSIIIQYTTQTSFAASAANTTPYDAEAFVVTSDTLLIFSKNWSNNTTQVYGVSKNAGSYSLDTSITFEVAGLITDAYVHPDKKFITLLGYNAILSPFVYLIYDWTGNYNFQTANQRKINITGALVLQCEGIFSHDGMKYWVSAEQFSRNGITFPASLQQIDLTAYTQEYLYPQTDTGTSIPRLQASINIYPNPASNSIQIENIAIDMHNNQLVLIDAMGRNFEVTAYIHTPQHISLDITTIPKGMYLLQDKRGVFYKIIKE